MRWGILRAAGRALRHGLVASGVCLLIAIVSGFGGALFDDRPAPFDARTVAASRDGAQTSTAVLTRWIGRDPSWSVDIPGGLEPESQTLPSQDIIPLSAIPLPQTVTVDASALVAADAQVGDQAKIERVPLRAPRPDSGQRHRATLSFYYCEESPDAPYRGDGGGFCGRVRDGSYVRPGVAACDVAYLGQRFRIEGDPTGRTYVCADTGSAVHGMHRDIWFLDNRDGWSWQAVVGRTAVIEVLP